jgi:hypothetical protein
MKIARTVGRATAVACTAALVLGLAGGTASARDGNAPLTTYGGCARMNTTDSGATDWDCEGPDVRSSSTVGDGAWIEVRYPGWCTVPTTDGSVGRKLVAKPFHRQRCG